MNTPWFYAVAMGEGRDRRYFQGPNGRKGAHWSPGLRSAFWWADRSSAESAAAGLSDSAFVVSCRIEEYRVS